jgi:hypothetical protein
MTTFDRPVQRTYLSDMNQDQYLTAIKRLGLNKLQAAELLGIDPRTQRRYTRGDRGVPEQTARFLKYLVDTAGTDAFAKLRAKYVKS